MTQDSSGKHCHAASSAECAMGGRGGWRLRKSSDGVVMIGMSLKTGGIPGTAGSWQLGKEEKCQRWMVRRQLGSQCSFGWCNHAPITRVHWVEDDGGKGSPSSPVWLVDVSVQHLICFDGATKVVSHCCIPLECHSPGGMVGSVANSAWYTMVLET